MRKNERQEKGEGIYEGEREEGRGEDKREREKERREREMINFFEFIFRVYVICFIKKNRGFDTGFIDM